MIVAAPRDAHAVRVAALLRSRGIAVECIQTATWGESKTLTYDPVAGSGAIRLPTGKRIVVEELTAVWYRRPEPVRIDRSITDSLDRTFAEKEWAHALDGFFATIPVRLVSPPSAQRGAVKPRQLAVARAAGLKVPDTLITNDVSEALAFIERYRGVVHKAMTAPPHRFVDTRMWTDRDREHASDLAICPVVLQEHVRGPSDIRVTAVGDLLFAARTDGPDGARVDSRLDLDAPCQPYTLPDGVAAALVRVMRTLGLLFATIDLKLTADGEHVFLEVNPQGQFLYVEILTKLPISEAVADFLQAGPESRSS